MEIRIRTRWLDDILSLLEGFGPLTIDPDAKHASLAMSDEFVVVSRLARSSSL